MGKRLQFNNSKTKKEGDNLSELPHSNYSSKWFVKRVHSSKKNITQ